MAFQVMIIPEPISILFHVKSVVHRFKIFINFTNPNMQLISSQLNEIEQQMSFNVNEQTINRYQSIFLREENI